MTTSPGARHHQPSPFTVAVVAELLALALSVAANLAAVWRDEPTQVWAAAALPFLLLVGTYLFLAHRVAVVWSWRQPGWLAWYANLAAGLAFLVPPAMTSYWHQRVLLLGSDGYGSVHGLPTLLATLLPLTVDGLAIRAALTLWSRRAVDAAPSATGAPLVVAPEPLEDDGFGGPGAVDQQPPGADGASDDLLPDVPGVAPDLVARAALLLYDEPAAGRPRLIDALGISDHTAKKLLKALRPVRVVGGGAAG